MRQYNPIKIENKWRKRWKGDNNYKSEDNGKKPKQYILDMYPYPSGAGLHVGHLKGYIGTDIYSRYKRMRGFNVLHPMGWDAFGLPAENYAIKTGVPPKKTTEDAIKTFKKQIDAVSLSYDWEREISSHNPDYYKWTQWFFLLLYKNKFAYKAKAKVNWDPIDQTVLANEQVLADGTAERSGAKVIQKDLEQWFFKITDFAQDLIDDLDKVDWPEHTIINQRNWIGRSEGATIKFQIQNSKSEISVFTTRPDTLFGATYMVLAPEHDLVQELKKEIENWDEVQKYISDAKSKTEIERTDEDAAKTGVEIKGVKAVNPVNKEDIPVFVSDYVLVEYGTGAIMAVPAHDERDFAFAKKFNIPIKQVVCGNYPESKCPVLDEAYTGDGRLVGSGKFDGLTPDEAKPKITEYVGGKTETRYRLRDWLISRQRYWGAPIPIVYDPDGKPHPVPEEHLPWMLPRDVEFKPEGHSPLATSKELKDRTEKLFGKGWTPEVDTIDTFGCSSWYFFRFTDPKNEKEFAAKDKLKYWMPVDLYVGGAEHTVLHLMYARFFTKVLHKLGYVDFDEPFLKLRHQGTIKGPDGKKMGKRYGNVVDPQEVVEHFGADTLRVYEMFMGPFEKGADWQVDGMRGAHRFLGRVWGIVQQQESKESENQETNMEQVRHRTIKKVTEDIESMDYNTAISAMMEYVNTLWDSEYTGEDVKTLLLLLSPFAPHITSELWEEIGESGSIHEQEWPEFDEKLAKQDTLTIPVQINGKVRAQVSAEREASEKELEKLALDNDKVKSSLDGKEPKKVIAVKNKIVNIVV